MNSSVIGTIELADQPIESLAPQPTSSLPARIRKAFGQDSPEGEYAIVTDEVLHADVNLIRSQLRHELTEIMRAVEVLGGRA
jgi:hypothetical protein